MSDSTVRIETEQRLVFLDAKGYMHVIIGSDAINALREFFAEEARGEAR